MSGRREPYGDLPSQWGELWLPSTAGRVPVVVLLHGGYWRERYGADQLDGLSADLVAHGLAAWNLEYRRLGPSDRGGWPATFDDVADGVDALARLAAEGAPLDLGRAYVAGHSAGGHLALWAAGRRDGAVQLAGAVAQAAVSDLVEAARLGLSDNAAALLLGGSPEGVPERYAAASPRARLPLGVPTLLVHGDADEAVPVELSRGYAAAARAAGDDVEYVELAGAGHMEHIDPRSGAWALERDWLRARARGSAPAPPSAP